MSTLAQPAHAINRILSDRLHIQIGAKPYRRPCFICWSRWPTTARS